MAKTSVGGMADEEEMKLLLQTISSLEMFSRDESLEEDAKVWITKKEAHLIWSFIYGLLHRIYGSDEVVPEEQ